MLWGALSATLGACAPKEAEVEPVRAVRTWRAEGADPVQPQVFAAEVRARNEAGLGFRVGGKLQRRDVVLGQTVRAGQVLARLDPADLQLARQGAQAGLAAADTQWAQAQADFQRFQTLREQGFISAAELERRKTALDAARAQRDQAGAASSLQVNQAAHAVLRADVAGVVTAVLADPGTVLLAGMPVLRLAQDGPRDAVFSVPEDQVQPLRALLGHPGALQVRLGVAGDVQPATLRELAAAADPATRTFLAKADLGSASASLGQTASVQVPAAPVAAGTLRVPVAALSEREGRSVVWLLDGATMKVQPMPVTVLDAQGALWRVRGELPAQPELVTAGLHVLQPGQQVRRYGAPAPARAAASAP